MIEFKPKPFPWIKHLTTHDEIHTDLWNKLDLIEQKLDFIINLYTAPVSYGPVVVVNSDPLGSPGNS